MKRAFLSLPFLSLLLSFTIAAQNPKVIDEPDDIGFNLRTSLNSYFDYDAGIMLGVGYRWSNRFSAAIEPTWIFYNGFTIENNGKTIPSGIKIRCDLKYHLSKKRRKRNPDFFIAPEFHYKYTKTQKEDLFGINCVSGQCAYFQDAVYTDVKNEIGGIIKLGLITRFPFVTNNRWLLEMYGGAGIKRLNFRETNLPVGGAFVNPPGRTPFGQPSNGFGLPMIPVGFKLIFVL